MEPQRKECLDVHWFSTLPEVGERIEAAGGNTIRVVVTGALGERAPHEFARLIAAATICLAQQMPETNSRFGTDKGVRSNNRGVILRLVQQTGHFTRRLEL
jgi:hypothetical protein